MNKTLIVCVPGFSRPVKKWTPMLELLKAEPELQNADCLRWEHKCSAVSWRYAENLSNRLTAEIAGRWESAKHAGTIYDNIILMGHSMGALLVRHAYLTALGSDTRGFRRQEWSSKVSRIVLFAGTNRGLFPPDEDTSRKQPYRIRRWIARHVIELMSQVPLLHFLTEDLLAGSDFVTNLRLWWIRRVASLPNPPTVVQVLGTEDSIVRRSDSMDIEQDKCGIQILVAGVDHTGVIEMKDKHGQILQDRYALIRQAVLDPFPPTPSPVPPDEQKDSIVFVLHGIRASNGDWVKQASEQLRNRLPAAEVVPATYWYFSAFDFLIPITRRRKLRWFQRYV